MMMEFPSRLAVARGELEGEDPSTTQSEVAYARKTIQGVGLDRMEMRQVLAAAGAHWESGPIERALIMMFSDPHRDDRSKACERHLHPTLRKFHGGCWNVVSGKGLPDSSGYKRRVGTSVAGDDVEPLPVDDLLDDDDPDAADADLPDDDDETFGIFPQRAFESLKKNGRGKGGGKGRARASPAGSSAALSTGADSSSTRSLTARTQPLATPRSCVGGVRWCR